MLKQASVYRDTYTNVSVRTGINRQTYYDNQWNLNNRLSSLGLRDNVRSSEVQTMWNSLANTGMNESQMFATAIDNVVTNKIVPYLDTTSQEFNLLNTRLNNDFVKDIRGINKANLEIAGNNYVTESLLNTIIDKVQPMSDEALQNLALGSTEITSFVNTLMSKGYDRDTAVSYATKYFQAQEYGDQMLSSGSTADKLFMADIMTNPYLNLYDLDDASNIMALYGNRALEFAGNLGGYSSSTNGVVTNMVAHSLGYTYGDFSNAYKLLDEGLTFTDIANNTSLTPAQISAYSNQATNTFASGQNQTVEELQSVTLENFMNELAVIYEKLGLTGPIIVGAIEGLGNILITWLGANLVGKLFGGNGSGLLSSLGSKASGSAALGKLGTGLASVGYQAAGSNALGMTTGQLAATGLATTAGAAALVGGGTALGINGINNVVSDVSSGNINAGTGWSALQGTAGLGAAGVALGSGISAVAGGAGLAGGIAAAATNPVGWALLAVAGIGMAGKAIYDATNTTVDLTEELQSQKDTAMKEIQDKNDATIDSMYEIREQIKQSTSYEEAKNKALQLGIISQEDLNSATDKSVEGLLDLADASIQNQKDLNDLTEQTVSAYTDVKNATKESAGNSIMDILNIAKAGGKSYNDMTDEQKTQMNQAIQAYIKYVGQYGTDKQKEQVQKWGTAFDDNTLSKGDFNKVFDGPNKQVTQWFKDFVTSDQGAKYLSEKDSLSNLYGDEGYYSTLSDDQVQQYISSALQADDTDDAKGYLKILKSYGLIWNKLPSSVQSKLSDSFGDNISSYRQGINNVPADQLAMLHQGEAVLTASTANELRNMTDVYRETTSQTFNLDAIIQNQTSALIIKMDEIIRAITTGVSGTQSLTRNTADAKVWDSMIHMESTKAF